MAKQIQFYDLKKNCLETEQIFGDRFIDLSLNQFLVRYLTSTNWSQQTISKFIGWYYKSFLSKKLVNSFIQEYKIKMDNYIIPEDGFKSFNDFFIRKIQEELLPKVEDSNKLHSPVSARLNIIEFQDNKIQFTIKEQTLALNQFIGKISESMPANSFNEGYLLLFRLCPVDYHRYHFPFQGKLKTRLRIPGQLFSVNPKIFHSIDHVFFKNERCISLLEHNSGFPIIMSEIGAIGVGGMIHHPLKADSSFNFMQEKGYFEFGGSAVALILDKSNFKPNPKILEYSKQGLESLVECGDIIGDLSNNSFQT